MEIWFVFGIIYFALIIPAACVSIFLFWKNRHQRHVAARVPFLTVAFGIADLFPITIWSVLLLRGLGNGWKGIPCFLTQPTVLSALTLAIFAVALRAIVLVFLFEIGKDVSAMHSLGGGGKSGQEGQEKSALLSFKPSFFTRHRRYVQPRMLRRAWLSLTGLLALLHVGTAPIADIPNDCSAKTIRYQNVWFGVVLTIIPIFGMLIAMAAMRLRHHGADAFGIRKEFRLVAFVILASIVLAAPGFVAFSDRVLGLRYAMFIGQCGATAILFVQCLYPLYLLRRYEAKLKELANKLAKIEKVDELLRVPGGFYAFLKFAQSEFTSENVLCWERLQQYKRRGGGEKQQEKEKQKKLPGSVEQSPVTAFLSISRPEPQQQQPRGSPQKGKSQRYLQLSSTDSAAGAASDFVIEMTLPPSDLEEIAREAEAIHKAFVAVGSSYEVNVSSSMRTSVTNRLHELKTRVAEVTGQVDTPDLETQRKQIAADLLALFDPIEAELVKLMQTNSFQRFRASSYAKGILSELSVADGTARVTRVSNLTAVSGLGKGGGEQSQGTGLGKRDAASVHGPLSYEQAIAPRLAFAEAPAATSPF